MKWSLFFSIISSGILSGSVFGLLMKGLEALTSKTVYYLLLNVDYVPIVKQWGLNEWGEFGIHLWISILMSFVFYFILKLKKWRPIRFMGFVLIVCMVIGLCLYPTTLLSQGTPRLLDTSAIFLWELGHLIFGLILGSLLLLIRESSITHSK